MNLINRISDLQLEGMLADIESDLTERKESFRGETPKKARQAVCAFANDLPCHNSSGILFIGARDDGTPSGMPPVQYDGRIWVRTGPRRSIANQQEERILTEKRRHKNLPYDIYPLYSATLNDLSRLIFENEYLPAAYASDVLDSNGRTYEERLAASRMIVSPNEPIPTVLGMLSLGKNPQDFIPGAAVQFLRISGLDLSDLVVDEEKIGGTLSEVIRRTEEKLVAHHRSAVDIVSGPKHLNSQDYPIVALQQLLYNAVLHRTSEITNAPVRVYWFDDRIEILSPGGPFGNVTKENFGSPGITDYRNPNIGAILKTYGYIQAFGRGIATAKKQMEKSGNPPLEFEVNKSAVLCTLRRKV